MGELNNIRIDIDKSTKGVWFKFVDDIELLIARKPNLQYEAFLVDLISQQDGEVAREVDMDLTKQAVANCVLLGWKNLTEDGKPIKYSPKKALELLRDPSLRDFYEFVLIKAHDREAYRLKTKAKQAKN